jgi:hypothetical protein
MSSTPTLRHGPSRLKAIAAASLLSASLLAAAPGAALAAAYIKFDGIDGEVVDNAVGDRGWSHLAMYSFAVPSPDGGSGFKPMSFQTRASANYASAVLDAMRQGKPMVATVRIGSGGGTVADDVIVDGRIITGENYDAASGTFSFVFGAAERLVVRHRERQRDGSWLETATGGWGVQGVAAFQGDRGVFDALDRLGAVRQPDGSFLITSAVPEPASYALLAAGLALIAARSARRTADSQA